MAAVASSSSSQITPDPLQATVFQRLHPRAYLERFLAEGFRPDGRETGEWRDVSVNVGERT
jgi:exosome complex component RRP43